MMIQTHSQFSSDQSIQLLSRLLLPRRTAWNDPIPSRTDLAKDLLKLKQTDFDQLINLADSHHVIVRSLEKLLSLLDDNDQRAAHAAAALTVERTRISNAQMFLCEVCDAFEQYGHKMAIIKSLDHWPDLGSDLDLFTNAPAEEVIKLMQRIFDAQIAPRSWGDRLACKWNFVVPRLRESVEVHVGRLGQTGEQVAIASILLDRTRISNRVSLRPVIDFHASAHVPSFLFSLMRHCRHGHARRLGQDRLR
jgi:hypothetical protein